MQRIYCITGELASVENKTTCKGKIRKGNSFVVRLEACKECVGMWIIIIELRELSGCLLQHYFLCQAEKKSRKGRMSVRVTFKNSMFRKTMIGIIVT